MTYTEHFQKIVEDQLARVEKLKSSSPVPDFAAKEKIIIGTIDGDGIGPVIMDSCRAIDVYKRQVLRSDQRRQDDHRRDLSDASLLRSKPCLLYTSRCV